MKNKSLSAVIRLDAILIPITQSFMESTPIIIIFGMLAQFLANTYTGSPFRLPSFFLINVAQIWLLRFLYSQKIRSQKHVRFFEVAIYIAAFLLFSAASLSNIFTDYFWLKEIIIALTAVVIWRTHIISGGKKSAEDHQKAFLIGFGAFVLAAFATKFSSLAYTNFVLQLFPIFALSGLITVSLARLSVLQKNLINNTSGHSPTMRWLMLTTLLSGTLLILSLVFDSFISLNMVEAVVSFFTPLWDVLGIFAFLIILILGVIIEFAFYPVRWFIYFLESLFHKGGNTNPPSSEPIFIPIQNAAISQQTVSIIQYILIALLALITIYIILRILQTAFIRTSTEAYDDIHEHLAVSPEISKKYNFLWPYDSGKIDDHSIRARYRELLEYIQKKQPRLARNIVETPLEYEQRLFTEMIAAEEPEKSNVQTALQALTNAYRQERYGQITTDVEQKRNARGWVKQITEHFSAK